MYSILNLAGQRVEAVILAVEPSRLRIAIQGKEDAEVLRYEAGQWSTESGEPVEFESLVAGDQTSIGASSKYLVTSERYQACTAKVALCVSSSCSPMQTRHSRPRARLGAGATRAVRSGAGMD